ncbi:DNA gyrase subunit B [subsurface metagenome]
MVELINQGHLFITQPPLYRASRGKTEEWLYSEDDLNKFYIKKAFENVSVYSTDESINLTGLEIVDYLESLKELNEGLNTLAKEAKIPRELGEFLLKKRDSFHRLDFTKENRISMLEVAKWLQDFDYTYQMRHDPDKDEYAIDVAGKTGKGKFDRQLFENPMLHRCFTAYPKVKHLVENKSYTIIKNKREIGKDIPWYKLAELLQKNPDRSGVALQRYKGLGEMSAEPLWIQPPAPYLR